MSTNVFIGQRLRAERQRLRLTQVELAEAARVSKTSQINYEAGTRSPDADYLAAVAARGVDVLYVVTGRASAHAGTAEGTFLVPRLEASRLATAQGVQEKPASYQLGDACVTAAWLESHRLTADQVGTLRVIGTSMQGVLSDGDLVVLDLTDTKPRRGFVYGMRQGEALLVAYCEPMPGELMRISSANPAFAPYDVDPSRAVDFAILGRVVASVHEW